MVIRTTGDRVQDRPLSALGGKGLFTREIEEALAAGAHRHRGALDEGHADAAAGRPRHRRAACRAPTRATPSSPSAPRRSRRCRPAASSAPRACAAPPSSATAAPTSRSSSSAATSRPGCASSRDGVAAATFLAMAGLDRLGLDVARASRSIPTRCCPRSPRAPSASRPRAGDAGVAALLAAIHDPATGHRLAAERAFLAGLDGSCQTPIAGLAELDGDRLRLRGEILRPDGSESLAHAVEGPVADAAALGAECAAVLRGRAGAGLLRRLTLEPGRSVRPESPCRGRQADSRPARQQRQHGPRRRSPTASPTTHPADDGRP